MGACVATPHPAEQRGDKKQAKSGDDQHTRQQDKILGIERGSVEVEFPRREIEMNQRLTIHGKPDEQEVHAHQSCQADIPDTLKEALLDPFDVDLFAAGV